ncbi:MAG: hypothetical protein LIR50_07155 [Bacillota bacterium]|nr:hypothetical protein [Bacillota bacterium]
MDIDVLEKTGTWELYEKHVNFMRQRKIYDDSDINYRMYNGDQWYGLKVSGVEKIQHNFIKQIVKQKTSNITSNLFAVNYSPENIENIEFMPLAQKTCDLLNKKASKVWDKDFMDKKVKKWAKQSAINDEAVGYAYYVDEEDMPVNEIISKNDIMYGDENEDEIQLQPYILIRQRKSIVELKQMAEKNQVDPKLIATIEPDNDTSTIAGDSGKEEVEDKCWLVTKFYRKNGMIYFTQSTKYAEIRKEKSLGTKLYPIAHWNWEDQEGNARGIGEVRQLIPNQLETNKTAMRRALTTKNISYPQKVINENSIQNISDVNKVGATIRFKDLGNTRASDVFMMTSPGQMGPDSEKLQSELISLSKDLANAGDATTGNVNPETASGRAILAVQQAQNQPLTDQLIGLKSFLEDLARIWFEMWQVNAVNGLTIENEVKDPMTGEDKTELVQVPSYILDALNTSVKVDITPKGAYDKYAQELSLENMFLQGKITFDEYVESLDADSVMPKVKLENILEKRKESQQKIDAMEQRAIMMKNQAQMQIQSQGEIENIAQQGNNMINQALA